MATSKDFFILGLVVIVEVLLIVSIFNFIHGNVKDTTTNKVVVNISELVTLIITTSLVMYGSLMGIVEPVIIGFLVGFSIVLIAVVWTIFRVDIIRKWFGIETGVNYDDSDDDLNMVLPPIENKVIVTKPAKVALSAPEKKTRSDKDFVVFSKYLNRAKDNNFSFGELYPDYQGMEEGHSIGNQSKDYSAYNGYPDDHICNGCECMRREDGYKFCGKFIPGMGTIGCSERWGCLNCKSCKQGTNTTNSNNSNNSNNDYSCSNCKCHDTDAGYICGKVDRTNGYVHKCKTSCPSCDRCYGADGTGREGGMITVDPESNLRDVKLNNENRILDLLN